MNMNPAFDTDVLELLASKICHDLISPIGAVNNGIEFMVEMGGGEEATDLIAYSAHAASAKLQIYRMAYGAGGADGSIKPEDVHKAFEGLLGADKKVRQSWDPHADLGYGDDRPDAFAKMLVCTLLMVLDSLPKGGEIEIVPEQGAALVKASGENAALKDQVEEALSGDLPVSSLSPKLIHAYVTALLARRYGFTITAGECGEDYISFRMQFPAAV